MLKSFFRLAFIVALISVAVGLQALTLTYGSVVETGIANVFGWLSLFVAFVAGSASAFASKETP